MMLLSAHTLLVILQATLFLCCLFVFVVLTQQKDNYLSKLMICITACAIAQNAGYILELTATSVGEAITAVRIEYLGGAFVATYLLVFTCKFCKRKMPLPLAVVLYLLDYMTLMFVWLSDTVHVYYKSIDFVNDGIGPHLILEKAPFYYFFGALLLMQMFASTCISFLQIRRTKNRFAKRNFALLTITCLIPIFGYSLGFVFDLQGYDAAPAGEALSILVFSFAIVQGHVFDIASTAHGYMVQKLEEAIVVVDYDDNFVEANDRALVVFPELAKEHVNEHFAHSGIMSYFSYEAGSECIIDGKTYQVSVTTIESSDHEIGKMLCLFDVTQKKQQLEEMRRLKISADEANQAKSDFLAKMSHEIRTPLNAVVGMDEMILRESAEEKTLDYAKDIKTASQTLLSIINDILDSSKIASQKMELLPVKYHLNSLLNDLSNMTKMLAREKNLDFEMNCDPLLPNGLVGDDVRIRQILMNLLTNAVKYTKQGKIVLTVGGEAKENEVMLQFCVEDTGVGIRKESMPKLFGAFERIDEEKNRGIEGTGLGMSIVTGLLKLMESELHVESVYGEGSRFFFTIKQQIADERPIGKFTGTEPAKEVTDTDAATEAEEEKKVRFTAPDAKVLLVDDSAMNRKVFRHLLKNMEMQITEAESGEQCLTAMEQETFDLVFLDHMMPGMDGMETMDKIHELPDARWQGVPIIMLTANTVAGAREAYLQKGFDDFLGKPIESKKLEEMVLRYLPVGKIQKE